MHIYNAETKDVQKKSMVMPTLKVEGYTSWSIHIITGRNEVVAKVIFLHLFVILFTGGVCLSAYWDTNPPGSRPPWDQTPPDQADTPPGTRPPRDQTPQTRQTHPRDQTPLGPYPPREADSSIRSTSGRYASYWNAFLLQAINALKYRLLDD